MHWNCKALVFVFLCLLGKPCYSFKYSFTRNSIVQHKINRHDHKLKVVDKQVWDIIKQEHNRQRTGIELIASENFVSESVMSALGSCMTNKYSEGQPGNRYYGGNHYIDQMELLCQKRAIDLFNLNPNEWSVNVQPYSGSPANFAAYTALLKPHDRIMGLDLPSGGHLTHGYQTNKRKVSATSVYFESMPYRTNADTGLIDYDELATLATAFKPKLIIAGASAYPRDWDYARMRTIADSVGAYLMADMAHIAGFVATGLMNNPFEHCDVVTTTTHKSLRGPRAGMIFSRMKLKEAVDQAVFPGLQGGPHNNQIAAVAVALHEAAQHSFHTYMTLVKTNAADLAHHLQKLGYTIVTGGTDSHIVLWDARSTGLSGAKLEKLLETVDISVNKNTLVSDVSALNPSGVRLGTLAMTTRGMGQEEMHNIAELVHRVVELGKEIEASAFAQHLTSSSSEGGKAAKLGVFMDVAQRKEFAERLHVIRSEVHALATSFPLPGRVPE